MRGLLAGIDRSNHKNLPAREARWLLEAAAVSAGRDPLFLLEDGRVTDRVRAVYRSLIARRARGEPLAYVIGEASFMGIDLVVTPDVLIPRPETEQLVELVMKMIPPDAAGRLLDQGTGSGAIAIAVGLNRPRVRITAVDVSESALDIAKRNVARHGLSDRIEVVKADLYPDPACGERKYDWIAANLPYVPDDAALPEDVRDWEPKLALRGGKTGRELIERSIQSAEEYLAAGSAGTSARLIYEIGEDQREEFEAWLGRCVSGCGKNLVWKFQADLTGRIRYLIGSMG